MTSYTHSNILEGIPNQPSTSQAKEANNWGLSLQGSSEVDMDTCCFQASMKNASDDIPRVQAETTGAVHREERSCISQPTMQITMPLQSIGSNSKSTDSCGGRQQPTDFLRQLSEAAVDRLCTNPRQSHEGDINDDGIKKPVGNRHDSVALNFSSKKNRDLERDVIGNCLHSPSSDSKITQHPASSSPRLKKKSTNTKSKDRENLRKGKWTVS